MVKKDLYNKLFDTILQLETVEECYAFFDDICTIGEIDSIAQRLEVAKLLSKNNTYLDIAKQTSASTATISRVKKCLNYGTGGYQLAIRRAESKDKNTK